MHYSVAALNCHELPEQKTHTELRTYQDNVQDNIQEIYGKVRPLL